MDLQKVREINGGSLPAVVWPGGYPLYYVAKDCSILCPDCANKEGVEPSPIDGDVNWEDPELICDDCGERIESAYAEKE